ncbi:Hypothetical_protein [Hexamita inflata]|uniref:Hypothetical_protein n=1 Tax=Hexamita inflata TaxID=28002 RepID=A0AA86TGC4_9EUKA|nr:Hypothetical protein HINF_LOCUS138 [Hexamita inflata]
MSQAKQPQSVFTNKCVQLILHVAWFRSGSATPTQVISADLELGSYATFVHGQQSKKKLFHQKLDVHATIKISMMYTNSEGFGKRVFQRQAFTIVLFAIVLLNISSIKMSEIYLYAQKNNCLIT